jgi:hypothetical protein
MLGIELVSQYEIYIYMHEAQGSHAVLSITMQ